MRDGIGLDSCDSQVLQSLPGYRRDEVEVVGPVEVRPQVLDDPTEVVFRGLAEVDSRHLGH